jgi:hypothetical protein
VGGIGSKMERVFYSSRRKVRNPKAIFAMISCALLSIFPLLATLSGIKHRDFLTPQFILGICITIGFTYVLIIGTRRLIRGGYDELAITSFGVAARGYFHPWGSLGYFGPSGQRGSEEIVLAIRRQPINPHKKIQTFIILDQNQPLKLEDYERLLTDLKPFLASRFPGVQIGQ